MTDNFDEKVEDVLSDPIRRAMVFDTFIEFLEHHYTCTPEELKAEAALAKIYTKVMANAEFHQALTVRLHPDFIAWISRVERNRLMRLYPLANWHNGPPNYFCGISIFRDRAVPYGDCIVEYAPE